MPQTMGDVKTSVLTPQGVMTVDVGKDECWRKTGETALVSLRGGRGGHTWWEGGGGRGVVVHLRLLTTPKGTDDLIIEEGTAGSRTIFRIGGANQQAL